MTQPIDLGPATRRTAEVLLGVSDDDLDKPTPCPDYTVGTLVAHVDGLSQAFAAAAGKRFGRLTDTAPDPAATRLAADWRARVGPQLDALAEAWRDPSAWEGMTRVGSIDLPGGITGLVGLTEVVIHGWDLAVATGQPYEVDPAALAACTAHVGASAAPERAAEREGVFGPALEVPADASPLDRLLLLSGRSPGWKPV